MGNNAVSILVNAGFSEDEALRQLSELGKLANAKIIIEIVGSDCDGKSPEEIEKLFTERMQIQANQEIAKSIYSNLGHEYLEAILKDLNDQQKELFLNSLLV
jgi:hypothetical protein